MLGSGASKPGALAVALVLSLAATAAAQGRDVVLRAEFPVDLAAPPSVPAFQGVVDPGYVARVPDGEAALALLAEARWTFSGMIWGFDYVYTPSDRARGIAELFTIEPRSPEAVEAMAPNVASARLDGTVLVAAVEYYPDAGQRLELASWRSASAVEQGSGSEPAFLGSPSEAALAAVEARRRATTAAIREALRAYLREKTHNKPREVRGSVALAQAPRLFVKGGAWVASVRVYARVDEILSYGAY